MNSPNSRSSKGGPPSATRYELIQEIGVGSFGTVYRGIDSSTGKEVAIKEVDLDDVDEELQDVQSEIAVLQACRSPNIVQYYGSAIVPGTTKLRIAMELMDASVASLVSSTPLSEPCIAYILREILNALVYLHSEHRMHRDIKAANVLLSVHGMVKVSDFGVAAQVGAVGGQKRRTFVGSPLWMAPEVIQQSPDLVGITPGDGGSEGDATAGGGEENEKLNEDKYDQRKSFEDGYDEAADIWSLGITAIEMARGEPPRNGVPSVRLLFLIVREPPPALEGDFSADLKDFVWQCLRKYPKDRPAAIDLLMHPFVAMAEMPQELPLRIKNFLSSHRLAENPVAKEPTNQTIKGDGGVDSDTTWEFGTVKSALPTATTTTPALVASAAVFPSREESLSFGTVVVRKDTTSPSSTQDVDEEEDYEEPRSFGTVVSRVPPPPQQQQLQIHEPPSHYSGLGGLASGTASTPAISSQQDMVASPMGFLNNTINSRPGGGGGIGGGGRQSRIAGANGGGPKTKESAINALHGMIDSLNYSKNSPAIDRLMSEASASLAEIENANNRGASGMNAVDLGPLGNYLVGQWNVT